MRKTKRNRKIKNSKSQSIQTFTQALLAVSSQVYRVTQKQKKRTVEIFRF